MSLALQVTGLHKAFPRQAGLFSSTKAGLVHAVNGVDLSLGRGRTLGLVGESGCGKTTTARLLLRMHEPDSGTMLLGDSPEDFFGLAPRDLRRERLRMQYIFQDPYASLDPKALVGAIVTEPLAERERLARRAFARPAREAAAVALLESVGLQADDLRRYPHEFSGGQRQRIAIARALSVQPELILCDEPVSSLDVSIQSQILNLINRLQREHGVALLFIGHNLPVVFYMSDEVAVMYAGFVVEQGPPELLYQAAAHPYTQLLRAASAPGSGPLPDRAPDEAPDLGHLPSGCPFAPRCPRAAARCAETRPVLTPFPGSAAEAGHRVACHYPGA